MNEITLNSVFVARITEFEKSTVYRFKNICFRLKTGSKSTYQVRFDGSFEQSTVTKPELFELLLKIESDQFI